MMEYDKVRYTRVDEGRNSLAALLGYPHEKVGRLKSPDILLAYQCRKSWATRRATDDWEFKVLRDGRLIYIHPCKRKTRCKETFQLPEACAGELLHLMKPREEELKHFFFATRTMGLDGWRDRFMFLGYEFFVWCPHRTPQEALSQFDEGSQLYVDALQNNKMLDLFEAGCAILKEYGFDATLRGIERIGNPEGST